jgi:glutamate racemase
MSTVQAGNPIIGLFDSGVGGLSVWREVIRRVPNCPTRYLADGIHCPYGTRPIEEVRRFSSAITRFLIGRGARVVVVACNTASAAALETLRAEFAWPVVGVEPAVKPAAERTRTGHVGILATKGTLNGRLFRDTSARYASRVAVHVQVGEGLVERVEAGQVDGYDTALLLRGYLEPMLEAGVDQIALGCTHYSFLAPLIKRLVPEGVSIIDPAAAVAQRVEEVLNLAARAPAVGPMGERQPTDDWRFFTTGRPKDLASVVHSLVGRAPAVERVIWDMGETRLVPYAE